MSPVYAALQPDFNRERTLSTAASVFIHALFFIAGGAMFVHTVEYGVESGGGVEVDLVAAPPAMMIKTTQEAAAVPEEKIEFPDPAAPVQPAAAMPAVVSGDGSSSFRSSAGAVTDARPKYLRNPAPNYPLDSRRRGEEGLVLLSADVDASGRASQVGIKKSSGYSLLDASALDAVRRWKFEPAKIGSLRVASQVEIPVRFKLKEDL